MEMGKVYFGCIVKLKNVVIIMTFIVCCSSTTIGQINFVEIEDDGWIIGLMSSSPAVCDLNGDGLYELVIGDSYGELRHYEQVGTNSGVFDFIAYSLDNIAVGGEGYAKPIFEDIDNDGLMDMFVGRKDGRISRYEQVSNNSLSFTLLTDYFANIDVLYYASPAFTDIDDDGKLDLVVGGWGGMLDYWEQSSPNSTTFSYVNGLRKTATQYIDVGSRSTPTFTDLDNDGKLDMIVGEQSGNLNYYEQSSSTSSVFTLIDESYLGIQVYEYSDPNICDIDNDNKDDLLIGRREGRMLRYEQSSTTSTTFNLVTNYFYPIHDIPGAWACDLYDITGDGKLDMFIGSDGKIEYWAQYAVNSSEFYYVTDNFANINLSYSISGIDVCDIDGDNLLEILIGTGGYGAVYIKRYEQDATGSTSFTYTTLTLNGYSGDGSSCPAVGNADGDNLVDILVGKNSGYIEHYEQDGVNSTNFILRSTDFQSFGDLGSGVKPEFTNLDSDSKPDLLISVYGDTLIKHYEMMNGSNNWIYIGDVSSGISRTYQSICPTTADINGSGNPDLVVQEQLGGRLLHYNNSSSSWGGSNTDWSDPANWNTSAVPDTLTDVDIPSGLSGYPVISDTAVCKSLNLGSGATITIQGGQLNITGDDQ